MIQLRHSIKIAEDEVTKLMEEYRKLDRELTTKHKLGLFGLPTIISTLDSKEYYKWLKHLKQ